MHSSFFLLQAAIIYMASLKRNQMVTFMETSKKKNQDTVDLKVMNLTLQQDPTPQELNSTQWRELSLRITTTAIALMKEMPVNAERAAILLWLHNFQLLKLHLRIIAKSIILVGNALDEAILELFDYLLIIESEINRKTTDPSEFTQVEKMMMISNGKTAKREMGREAIKESDLVSDSDIETDGHVSKKFVQRGGTNAKAVHGESLKMKESEMTSRQEQTMILRSHHSFQINA